MLCNQFLAPDGKPSQLFSDLEDKYGRDKAVQMWNWSKIQFPDKEPPMAELEARIGNTGYVKPEIPELFESNPELANAVYEALGFTNKLKVSLGKELEYKDPYAKNRIKDFKKYEVLDENGKNIGTVVIEDRRNKTVILHPELSVVGKGYGKELYKSISSKLGVTIQEWNEGAISNSGSAKKMWDSLEKEGSAIRIVDKEQGDNFRQLTYKPQITPQQKQQAQQLYSQYLDTIFPDSKVKDIVYHGTNKDFSEFVSGKGFWGNAFYVTTEKGYANSIAASRARQEPGTSKIIKPLLINANNIEFEEDAYAIDKFPENIDTILTNIEGGAKIIYAVSKPEQIHILGSKQDIEGFKKWSTVNISLASAPAVTPLQTAISVITANKDFSPLLKNYTSAEISERTVKELAQQIEDKPDNALEWMGEQVFDAVSKWMDSVKKEETGGVTPVTVPAVKDKEGLVQFLEQLFTEARNNPGTVYKLPFNTLPYRIGKNVYSALEMANMIDRMDPPANIGYNQYFARLFRNIPRNFVEKVQDPALLSISEEAVGRQMDTFFVQVRDTQKQRTGRWFNYELQNDVIQSMISVFYKNYTELTTNPVTQREYKESGKTVMEFVKDKVKQHFETSRRNWLLISEMYKDADNLTEQKKAMLAKIPQEMLDSAEVLKNNFTDVINAFEGQNSFWEFTLQRLRSLSISFSTELFTEKENTEQKTDEGDIVLEEGMGLMDYFDDVMNLDMKDTASGRIKLFMANIPESEFSDEVDPKEIKFTIHNETTQSLIKNGLKTSVVLKAKYAQDNKIIPEAEVSPSDINPKEKTERLVSMAFTTEGNTSRYRLTAKQRIRKEDLTPEFVSKVETTEGFTPAEGDVIAEIVPYVQKFNLLNLKTNSLGMPRLCDFEMLFQDSMGVLAGNEPVFETYVALLESAGNANLVRLAERLKAAPAHIQKEFTSVMSSHYRKMGTVLIKSTKEGGIESRLIDTNQNSEIKTLIRLWQENQKNTN